MKDCIVIKKKVENFIPIQTSWRLALQILVCRLFATLTGIINQKVKFIHAENATTAQQSSKT